MDFETDAFISYAHLDNQALVEGASGWVANFHRALEIRVGQLLGKEPKIWRDRKLTGSDVFEDKLISQLKGVAILISVLSPRYVKSEWTRRELTEFWNKARDEGGVQVGDKARIFKVLKTPVPLDLIPPELQQVLGYEFFKVERDTGKPRELDQVFGPEAQREFWMKVDDVAHDLCYLLHQIHGEREAVLHVVTPAPSGRVVYLAETTFDVRDAYDAIKRDLQQHGHTVLPSQRLPHVDSEAKALVASELQRCSFSIHLVGRNYSLVPEGGTESLAEIQNELAIQRAAKANFGRLLWIPADMEVADERQRRLIERFRTDSRFLRGADLLESSLEDLSTLIQERLKAEEKAPVPVASAAPADGLLRVYFICDERDQESVAPWADYLFEQGFEVLNSVFDGDESEVREYHEESLRTCDAALIHYGSGNELWLRRKLREIQKSAGYERAGPIRAVAICVAPPATAQKAVFRTREAMVISQAQGFSPDSLTPFMEALKAGAAGS